MAIRRIVIDHVLFVVGDFDANRRLYTAALAPLGYTELHLQEDRVHCGADFNRGGDRIADNALWRIVLVRMSFDSRTRNYVNRRTKEGPSKKEIIRCLKPYMAREVYRRLVGVDNQ